MQRTALITKRSIALQQQNRCGLSLLEVLISTAIFVAALTAIMQIIRVGHDSRLSAKLDAEAILRCESLMAELICGLRPLEAATDQPFEDNEEWVYTVGIEDGGGTSLLMLSARVSHVAGTPTPNSSFQLVRLMRDPQLFLDAAQAAAESAAAEAEE